MIEITLALDDEGLLRSCGIQGHGGGKAGTVACAAVSVLIRTALRVLADKPGIEIRGEASERGALWMEADYTPEGREFLSTAGLFLIRGLESVAEDYPGQCGMTIITKRRN